MAEISRRTLISRSVLVAGVGIGAVLGLSRTVHHKVAVPPAAPPAALLAALNRQRALLAGYALQAKAGSTQLRSLQQDVAAHGDALRALLELYPGWRLAQASPTSAVPSAPVANPPATVAALASASKAAAAATSTACLQWPAGEAQAGQVVPVLGSIAACLSTHAAVLS
ncbi:MAG: hypothetical protein M3Y42_11930 [Actinomycetota bacterium]|nr:hypothetical protein [Actinomycetota bacterium]